MFHVKQLFEQVKNEAQELNIPVPENVNGEIIINKRPKKRFGCCHFKNGEYFIEISEFILESPQNKIKEVIAHELLHTCRDCRNHGETWKQYADMMNDAYGYNIKRVSSFENMGIDREESCTPNKVKYIIKCSKCGKEYPRQRFTCVMKKIKAYRCQCGGELSVRIIR